MATPRHYWVFMIAGLLLGAIAGVGKEYLSFVSEQEELAQALTEAFGAERATELLTVAKRFAAGGVTKEEIQKKWLGPEMRERLASAGIEDPLAVARPYRNFRNRSVPVALVLALPGSLLGLVLAELVEKRRG